MKNRTAYSYSILRYVHDVASGEVINIGVALHSPDSRFFRVICRKSFGRLSEVFPDLKVPSLKSLIKGLMCRFEEVGDAYATPMELDSKRDSVDLKALVHSVLGKDDSSLIWSNISSGTCVDPAETLRKLFARYVSKYDHKTSRHNRSDEDVWRSFKRSLENRQISTHFKEKVIQGADDEVKFHLAWKNGIWHCVESISFDLNARETIRDKAHKFVGQIASVSDSPEQFKLYLVVGKPNDRQLDDAFDRAVKLIQRIPMTEVYLEEDRDNLIDKLSAQIQTHEQPMEQPRH